MSTTTNPQIQFAGDGAPGTVHQGDLTLAYRQWGPPDAPAVLLLHGLSASAGSWGPAVDALGRDWQSFALDFRGHGRSDHAAGAYALADYCADAEAMLDRIGRPTIVVGHSLGAVVASMLADHPLVRAVVLEDPPTFLLRPEVFTTTPYARAFTGLHAAVASMQEQCRPVTDFVAALAATPHQAGGTLGERMFPDALEARAHALAEMDPGALAALLDGYTFGSLEPDLGLPRPTLVLRADPACDAWFLPEHVDRLRRVNPHARIELIRGAGHNIRGDRHGRARYLQLLTSFLAELAG